MNDEQIDRLAAWLKSSFEAPNQLIGTPDRTHIARRLVGDNPERHKALENLMRDVAHPEIHVRLGEYLNTRERSLFQRAFGIEHRKTDVDKFARFSLCHSIDEATKILKKENRSERRRETVKGALAYLGVK